MKNFWTGCQPTTTKAFQTLALQTSFHRCGCAASIFAIPCQ